ncbi:MAG: carbohydrate porin, partial [Wenzhouxiangella sp.]|nr:carbohydrate porin [Wenzhouxiangella sp.]
MLNTSRLAAVSALLAGALLMTGIAHGREVFDDHLTGDWRGKRTAWLEQGINLEAFNTSDGFWSIQGGLSDGTAFSNEFELITTADLAALFAWPGATLYLHTAGSGGREPVELSGSIHEPSDLVDDDALKVLEFWIEQSLFQQRLSILAGLFEADSEFDVRETADVFLNSGFGFGLELPDIEIDGPSMSSLSGLGLRARLQVAPQFGLTGAVIEGVSGELDEGDGRFWIGEADWQPQGFEFLRLGLGTWQYSGRFERLDGSGTTGSTRGAYAFVEGVLFNEAGTRDQGLSGFVRIGRADQRVNRFGRHQAAGLVYVGLIPGRDEDLLGLGVSSVVNGDDFINLLSRDGERAQRRETVVELTYHYKLLPGLSVQPSIQYTVNPDT